MQWFRVYNEILDDPKIAKMDGETFRCFIYLLAVISEQESEGILNMRVEDAAWRLRISPELLSNAITYMIDNKIIRKDKNRIIIINWNKRQFSSDDVSKRVKRYREKRCNVTGNVTSNVIDTETDTETDTDTDTDTEKKQNADAFVLPEWIPKKTWTEYLKTRKKKKAAETKYALDLVISELQKIKTTHNHDPVDVLNKSIKSGWIDVYPLKNDGGNGNGNGSRSNNTGSPGQTFTKAGIAKSDGQPWPADREY
jgi:hypothetical protein